MVDGAERRFDRAVGTGAIAATTTEEAGGASVVPVNRLQGGNTMKLTVHRAIPVVLVLDVALFMASGISRYKNAKHGADSVIGEIVWLGFLVGALALLALAGTAGARAVQRRRVHEVRA
jgi:hypothetical protein